MSEIVKDGSVVTIKPGCDIVASVVDGLKTELKGIVENGITKLTVDLAETTIVDSMGIGILIATYNSLKKKDAQMELVNVSAEIASLLKNMRLNQYFTIS